MNGDLGIYKASFFETERERYPEWPQETGHLQKKIEDIEGKFKEIQDREIKRADEISSIKEEIFRLLAIIEQLRKREKARNIYIQNLRHPNYVLTYPISVTLEFEENKVIASQYDIDMYGSGDNEEEAIDDLCEVIVEYYEALKADERKLGPLPQRHWVYLKKIIKEE